LSQKDFKQSVWWDQLRRIRCSSTGHDTYLPCHSSTMVFKELFKI